MVEFALSGRGVSYKLHDIDALIAVWIFVGLISLFHFLLGVAIILKNRMGFGIFKTYLQCMYIAFPIGTILSRKTLDYIKKNNIERFVK